MTIHNKIDGWTNEFPTTPGYYVWGHDGVINKKIAFIYFKYPNDLVINFEGTVDGTMGEDESFLSNVENREWLKIS